MKILITGVGGPTPRSFAIALRDHSAVRYDMLIATDSNPLAVGLYQKDLFSEAYVVPNANDPLYWEVMDHIISKHQIDVAIILPEAEVLAWSRRMQHHQFSCAVLLPDPSLVELLIDKGKMTSILNDTGWVPNSIEFSPEDSLEAVEKKLRYPFWVRSSSGTSGLGSLKIENRQSLQTWVSINPGVKRYLASTFLPGRNLACKLLYYDGALIRAASGERVRYIMAKVAPSGITGNTSFGRLLNEPELVARAQSIMDKLFDYTKAARHGFFTVDFKEDEAGEPYVTEVNVRHVAFSQCFAAAGANFASDTVRLLSDDPTFDRNYRMYEFEDGMIFLRDVDVKPIIFKEHDLLKPFQV